MLEATPGFEPGMGVLQTPALTTWPRRLLDWCRGGDLNPYARRHGPLKTACLPNSTTSAVAPKLRSDSPRLPGPVTCWQEWRDSNPRPAVLETAALPTELHSSALARIPDRFSAPQEIALI